MKKLLRVSWLYGLLCDPMQHFTIYHEQVCVYIIRVNILQDYNMDFLLIFLFHIQWVLKLYTCTMKLSYVYMDLNYIYMVTLQ